MLLRLQLNTSIQARFQVLVMDQPLFTFAKTIQWNFPATHGEDKYVIMFGGLCIEIAALKVIGDWIDSSGWATAVSSAGIATGGVANSLLKVTHVTRSIMHMTDTQPLCQMKGNN